jgi:hypothetical protein
LEHEQADVLAAELASRPIRRSHSIWRASSRTCGDCRLSAFDDGSKVYIEMPGGIAQGEAPPLFVIGPEGDGQLVNYRVKQNYYIVDRLFAAAELRMGGEHQQTVRISRTDGRVR